MSDNLPEPVAGQLARPGQFAERTAELARQEQPVVRWRRAIEPLPAPIVLLDQAVRVDPADLDDVDWAMLMDADCVLLLDVATGHERRIHFRRVRVLTHDPADRTYRRSTDHREYRKEYRGMVVRGQYGAGSMVAVMAHYGRDGRIVWQHEPVPQAEYLAGPWSRWLSCDHQDVDLLVPYGRDGAERLALLDPATGQVGWDIAWSGQGPPACAYNRDGQLTGNALPGPEPACHVRLAVTRPADPAAGLDDIDDIDDLDDTVDAGSLAGIDEATGEVLWRIGYPAHERHWHWKDPVYLGSMGRYLVIAGVVGAGGKVYGLYDDFNARQVFPCRCPGYDKPPDGWAAGTCPTCKGVRHASIMVAVHDRLTGRRVWSHRWPDRSAPFTHPPHIADLCGDVVVTHEGNFLRGRRIEDGRALWVTVPPPRYGLTSAGRSPASQWARLVHAEASGREPDLFIHAATGRLLTIPGTFHQTRDGLVLTCSEGMLACLELPGHGTPSATALHDPHAQVILVDTSRLTWEWLASVKRAVSVALDCLPDGTLFAIAGGSGTAPLAYPAAGLAVAGRDARARAIQALDTLQAGPSVPPSRWLGHAQALLASRPGTFSHVLFLGCSTEEGGQAIRAKAQDCSGLFTCDWRGMGTGWDVAKARDISSTLLGTEDIVRSPDALAAEVIAIVTANARKR